MFNYLRKFLLVSSYISIPLVAMENNKILQPTKSFINNLKKSTFVPTDNTKYANNTLSDIVKNVFMDSNGNWKPKVFLCEKTLQDIETCLEQKADPNSTFGYAQTPLFHLAVIHQIKFLCDLLLDYSTNINASDIYKRTPLHILIHNFKDNPNTVNVEYLLQNGADPNAKADIKTFFQQTIADTLTPLSQAIWYQRFDYVKPLIEHCANIAANNANNPLKYAIHNNDIDAIQLLCKTGISPIGVDTYNNTIFHLTADNEKIIKILLTNITFKTENCQQSQLELVNEHIQYIKHVLQIKNNRNETALNSLSVRNLTEYERGNKTEKEKLLDGTTLQEDLEILNKVYPDLSSIPENNLARQILENHYILK